MNERILMIVTSADHLDPDHPTGLWFEEFAVPYRTFTREGLQVTVASPAGGEAPVDPKSEEAAPEGDWTDARKALKNTRRLADLDGEDFDAVFFPGGHGPMMDLPDDADVQRLVRDVFERDRFVAAMCHGPAGLLGVRLSNGSHLVDGRKLTSFTNAEERESGLEDVVPFLLEDALRERGAKFVDGGKWADHVERDGRLITGQNPPSSENAARALVKALRESRSPRPEARP